MIYKQIRPLAFQFASKDELLCDYYTLEFPEKWKTILQDLQTSATSRNSHPTSIPISTLNKALRSLVPDLISIARNAHHSGARPWLYSRQEIDKAVLFLIVKAWVKTNFKANEQNRHPALEKMSADDLQWKLQKQVNLAHWTIANNGIAEWQDNFILLADEIAARISQQFQFECDDSLLRFGPKEELTFRRASLHTGGRGAELISWPPFCHEKSKKRWYYSVLLTITVQTVPFQSFPVIYIDVGVRRWCGEKITYLPGGEDTSVYLLTSVPWIQGLTQSHSFSVAPIRYGKSGYEWGSKLGDLLNELQFKREFPKPSEIINNPATALNINDDNLPSAAVLFRSGIKHQHDVDSGVMPGERSWFLEQIAKILNPDFKLTELLNRVKFSFPKRQNPFAEKTEREDEESENNAKDQKKEPKTPKKEPKKPEDYAKLRSQRRHAIGETVNKQLTVEIWYQSETVREALIKAVCDYMGIYAGIEENPPSLPHTWETPELTLTIHVEQLGEIGAGLDINTNKSNITDRLHEAIRNRCKQIEKRIPSASGATVALIELGGKSSFDDNADPKYALRLGFATRGRLTQVIDRDADSENLSNRAKSVVLDALRQLGVWPLQPCEESNKVQQLNLFESTSKPQFQPCVGLWMIKHYSRSSPTRVAYFLPVMVYLEWYKGEIYAIAPGFNNWLPYREALLAIAQGKAQGYKEQKQATNWIQQTIGKNLPENTLLICHAQNLRGQAWKWLQNPNLTRDYLAFGDETPTHISKFPGLRIVRVRDDGGHETPEWYALDEKEKGFSEGIFSISERVFASTGQKPVQQINLNKNLAKFSRREAKGKDGQIEYRSPQPNKPAWNPQMIEIAVACIQSGDKPEHWAALVHELRQIILQYQGRTQLPFPLHLASKMEEYTLPVEDENY